jgi:hypothetical protein
VQLRKVVEGMHGLREPALDLERSFARAEARRVDGPDLARYRRQPVGGVGRRELGSAACAEEPQHDEVG